MKRLTTVLLVAAMAAMGCGEESEPGGPGADPVPQANGNGNEMENEDNTFKMTVPSTATDIQAGGSQSVTVSIDREDQFNEAVTLQFTAPQGIQVEPQQHELTAGVDEADVTITVDPTAQPGEHRISVTATPASGQNPVTSEFMVEVEAAEGGAANDPAADPAADPAVPPAQPVQP